MRHFWTPAVMIGCAGIPARQMHRERGSDSTTGTDKAALDRASNAKLKDVSPRHAERESEHPAGRVAAHAGHGGETKGARREPGKKG
jgi:hypothetical protein